MLPERSLIDVIISGTSGESRCSARCMQSYIDDALNCERGLYFRRPSDGKPSTNRNQIWYDQLHFKTSLLARGRAEPIRSSVSNVFHSCTSTAQTRLPISMPIGTNDAVLAKKLFYGSNVKKFNPTYQTTPNLSDSLSALIGLIIELVIGLISESHVKKPSGIYLMRRKQRTNIE